MNIAATPNLNLNLHFQIHHSRRHCYKRRRFKPPATRTRVYLTCTSNLLDPFHNFLSQFPSPTSLEFLAPALALASTPPLLSLRFKPPPSCSASSSHVGDWALFTSPTPFNRFVLLRCPSVSFEGGELLENVNERLVKEERHFVRLDTGRILCEGRINEGLAEKLEYQRVCVNTEDGGVISLDWPANLELEEEHGLDATLLLVPGTAEGSMNENIRLFVVEALKHGFFPVVMNPRGCAGSPLTTARLFTAADSDDISSAIQFINKARPWTTLLGVGWGYGANMLTKYLAEVGEETPLTAATCINNPFDLEEATRCSPYHIKLDKKLAGGLIDILRANKTLFQGRAKGFDVENALSAKSIRDFEKAISMVSYGFEEVEEFYSKSSTRNVVGSVKIPVLFIQNDDGTVPLFSIPRGLIAENPFTSLLLCSCLPSSGITSDRADISWYQNLTIEWLAAVELGLLKGRHPLLKDVDVSISPTKGLALMNGRASGKDVKGNKVLDLSLNDANGSIIEPVNGILEDSNTVARIPFRPRQNLNGNLGILEGLEEQRNVSFPQTGSASAEGEKASTDSTEVSQEETVDPIESDTGEVLQTAQVVMNMLDVSMPGVLSEEEKKKVLTAVGQGETVMKALQDAVPEEVRGKLTTAVSGIVNAQSRNFKFDRLLGIGKAPSESSGLKSKIQDKVKEVPSGEDLPEGPHSSDEMKTPDGLTDGSANNQPGADRSGAGHRPDLHASENAQENAQESVDSGQSQSTGNDASGSVQKRTDETGNNNLSDETIKEKVTSYSDSLEKRRETSANPNLTKRSEKPGGMEDSGVDDSKADQDNGVPQLETKTENSTQKNEEKIVDSSADQNKMSSSNVTEAMGSSSSGSSTDSHSAEGDGSDEQKRDNKTQPALDQTKLSTPDSNSSTFNVVQALDALTEMDDSTQLAVNSVFGVIEDMISHFEEKNDENQVKDAKEAQGESSDSKSKKPHTTNDSPLKMQDDDKNGLQGKSESSCSSLLDEHHGNDMVLPDATSARLLEGETTKTPILLNGGNVSQGNGTRTKEQTVRSVLLADYSEKNRGNIKANPYGDYLHKEYFHRYLYSKIPNAKSLDLDMTTALFLDYFPEEGRWKLLEQPENNGECSGSGTVTTHNSADRVVQFHASGVGDKVDYIEPSYVVLDGEQQHEPVAEYDTMDSSTETVENGDSELEEMKQFVKLVMLDALSVEVGRRLSAADIKQMKSKLDKEIEEVANAVSLAVVCNKDHTWCAEGVAMAYSDAYTSKKVGTLCAEHVIKSISAAIQNTSCLRILMPIGVIVGSSLAALRKYFYVSTKHENGLKSPKQTKKTDLKDHGNVSAQDIDEKHTSKTYHSTNFNSIRSRAGEVAALMNINNDSVMVGAVTAALGASAFLVQQQNPSEDGESGNSLSRSLKEGGNNQKVVDKTDEALAEKHPSNIVTSFAEKAMSVAGPVVPTKEDGEVDQERLVAMLADLGQKGGMLRLVGKIALLWGGIRGAMSLTDKLISFLHIAERPLYQRILGFVGMVLVLWSPVTLPLLPTLVQSWTTGHPSKFAELVIIIGLYTSVTILVMLWGRRIRGYEDPLKQYGMDLTTMPKVQSFLKGLVGGVALVLAIQSVNASLGFVSFSWPSNMHHSSLDVMRCLQAYGRMIILAVRGIITATGVVVVEELLFRSWLPQEVAADLGYYHGVIISGLAFAILQRSVGAIPGLWLFSLALSGFRERSQGSLAIPIGFRAGAMASSFIIQTGGFLIYSPSLPTWVTGTHPFQPFTGVVGLAFSLILAAIVYPREPLQTKENL